VGDDAMKAVQRAIEDFMNQTALDSRLGQGKSVFPDDEEMARECARELLDRNRPCGYQF